MKTLPIALPSARPLSARLRERWPRVVAAFESPWMASALLLLLQLKIIWGVWLNRDVTIGDTTSYFLDAWRWYTTGEVNIVWSPLYTVFYGSFLYLNPDAVWATFAHRVVIVLVATVLVLAVLRQVLPAAVAWLCAAWWAVLPIVFNTLYEVHLFAVIPVLTSWLLILTSRGPWRRAAGLAVLGLSVILVRNELSVPFGLLGAVMAGYELRRLWRREPDGGNRIGRTLLAYVVSLGAAAALIMTVYHNSYMKYPDINPHLEGKHTVNMAQVYSFGYQQRHPEWSLSPWLEYHGLMQDDFGKPLPSLREMIAANPGKVWEHFAWNLSLTPSGVQLLLFNRASGSVNPDYDLDALRRLNSRAAVALTAVVLTIWVVGFVSLLRTRRQWLPNVPAGRALGWLAMLAVAAVVPLVIMTQRPRPSYLFSFSVLLIAVTGLCFCAATARWRLAERLRLAMPLVMVGLALVVPRYFGKAYAAGHPQIVANTVHRLAAHRAEIVESGKRLAVTNSLAAWYAFPMVRFGNQNEDQRLFEIPWLLGKLKPHESFPDVLVRFGVDSVYLDEWTLMQLEARSLDPAGHIIAGRAAPGWQLIDSGNTKGDRWRLYRRAE